MKRYANIHRSSRHAPIAQLDRVTDYESVGRGFESLSAYHNWTPILIPWVSKQLGHHKISTTEDFYSHLIEQNKEKAADCIAATLLRRKQA